MRRNLLIVVLLSLLALVGCGAEPVEPEAKRGALTGDSPLIAHFREAETAHGVPAEMLATIAWLQTRLSHVVPEEGHDDHGLREYGVMAIGTGGLTTLEQAATLVALTPDEVASDPRSNVMAAAALLADEARRQGLSPETYADWARVLDAYGGEALTEGVLRLLKIGWNGWDDAELPIEVEGVGADAPEDPGEGLGVVQQGLGFPGAKWSPAYGGNYSNASRGSAQINYVVIHTIQGSYAGAISWFKNPSANVSSHYVVRSSDGAVTQMVDDRDIAWHDGCFNTNSIGIEHEGFVSQPKKWYTDEMYVGSARLTSWLCDKYNIPKDRKHIMGHAETPDCSDHTDPGSGWDWNKYMKLVKNGGKIETVKAKLVKKSATAKRFRGKKAHYIVCSGDDFEMNFTFKNTGSAVWRDVKKRGDKVGSDVFLVTASGKKDKLTGKIRYSVRNNKNRQVRGDRKAKNCSTKNGCRKTTFIDGGIKAKAPKKPGIYKSRWRLRDYSKAWGKKSKGFGPKVELRVKVADCTTGQCGCWVWCTNGQKKKVAAEGSAAHCKEVGKSMCEPAGYLAHQYTPCNTGSGGSGSGGSGSGGSAGASGSSGSASGGSGNETGGGDPSAGTDPGTGEDPGAQAPSAEEDPNGYESPDVPEPEDELEPEDDPGFSDEGFEGDEDSIESPSAASSGCSVADVGATPKRGAWLAAGLLLAIAFLGLRRRRRRRGVPDEGRSFSVRASRLAGSGFAAFGFGVIALSGCSVETGDEPLGWSQQAVSAPKKAYCKIPVDGKGVKDMETDYLPHVITCENGGAGFEALKAQAIAARSVAYYAMATKGSICDSQGCQVYGCGASPSEAAKKAVRETAGMYLSYGGTLTYAFYVAGGSPSSSNCHDTSGSTSHYVTYNQGKTGKSVEQTSLGWIGAPGNGQNRGCMSQLGARCLESKKDFSFLKILRFYYGSDIKVVQADGPCVGEELTLKAKLTKKWSNAKRFRGKKADYVVCSGDPFEMAFTFKNTGSAVWRDVKGRGKKIGDDVFLVTANGKKDKLTGKTRYSVKLNENRKVRGDRKAKNCSNKNECRKTTFIKGGIQAKAPKKPGTYKSRWRLRDYSKEWGKKSKGFGPKVELKVKVKECSTGQCGCWVWCTNGEKKKVAAEGSSAHCREVGKSMCEPAAYLAHQYTPCESPGTGGTGGTGSGGTAGSGGSGATGSGGSGATGSGGTSGGWGSGGSGSTGSGGASGSGSDPIETQDPIEDDPNGLSPDDGEDGEEDTPYEVEDDEDFEEDGFNGDEEGIESEAVAAEGCSTVPRSSGAPTGAAALALLFAGVLVARRRRGSKEVS